MNGAIKTIIIGFALMLLGGFMLISISASQGNIPPMLFLLSYSLYAGFFLIILGVLIYPKDNKDNKD